MFRPLNLGNSTPILGAEGRNRESGRGSIPSCSVAPVELASRMRRVYFHRDYRGFTGGHLKVWDYFSHVDATQRYRAEIYFTPLSIWAEHNPWFLSGDRILSEWRPDLGDIVFLAGFDWESIAASERNHFPRPIINLVQGLSHSDPQDAKFGFLGHRAIRICCSPETYQGYRQDIRLRYHRISATYWFIRSTGR
jgi:hypothetical protein